MTDHDLGFTYRFIAAQNNATPTLLLLHGTGGTEDDLLPLGHAIAPGAALLSPRGQVLENGMSRFFRRLAEGVFDIPDLKQRTQKLADFVVAASEIYQFDTSSVIALGYSNGANIAASILLLRPEIFAGAILLHPMVPLVPDTLPDLAGLPIFMGAGRHDPIVPPAETQRLANLLQKCGADVDLQWQPGGHGIGRDEVSAAQQWFSRHFQGA